MKSYHMSLLRCATMNRLRRNTVNTAIKLLRHWAKIISVTIWFWLTLTLWYELSNSECQDEHNDIVVTYIWHIPSFIDYSTEWVNVKNYHLFWPINNCIYIAIYIAIHHYLSCTKRHLRILPLGADRKVNPPLVVNQMLSQNCNQTLPQKSKLLKSVAHNKKKKLVY